MKREDLVCCYPDCERIPDWRINLLAAGHEYDETHSCMEHVGFLLWEGCNHVEPIEYNMEIFDPIDEILIKKQ